MINCAYSIYSAGSTHLVIEGNLAVQDTWTVTELTNSVILLGFPTPCTLGESSENLGCDFHLFQEG